ncbi:DUF551 domain-containing protein [Alcaligenes nematophilus]
MSMSNSMRSTTAVDDQFLLHPDDVKASIPAQALSDYLPDATKMTTPGQWISVYDRLPDVPPGVFSSTKVLAFWQGGDPDEEPSGPDVSLCGSDGRWQRANGEMDYFGDGRVTHWQPLPEPPGVTDEGKQA